MLTVALTFVNQPGEARTVSRSATDQACVTARGLVAGGT